MSNYQLLSYFNTTSFFLFKRGFSSKFEKLTNTSETFKYKRTKKHLFRKAAMFIITAHGLYPLPISQFENLKVFKMYQNNILWMLLYQDPLELINTAGALKTVSRKPNRKIPRYFEIETSFDKGWFINFRNSMFAELGINYD